VAIASGGWHNLALQANGTVVAWGAGGGTSPYVDYGQTNVPVGLTNVMQIAAGLLNSLALVGTGPPMVQARWRSRAGVRTVLPPNGPPAMDAFTGWSIVVP